VTAQRQARDLAHGLTRLGTQNDGDIEHLVALIDLPDGVALVGRTNDIQHSHRIESPSHQVRRSRRKHDLRTGGHGLHLHIGGPRHATEKIRDLLSRVLEDAEILAEDIDDHRSRVAGDRLADTLLQKGVDLVVDSRELGQRFAHLLRRIPDRHAGGGREAQIDFARADASRGRAFLRPAGLLGHVLGVGQLQQLPRDQIPQAQRLRQRRPGRGGECLKPRESGGAAVQLGREKLKTAGVPRVESVLGRLLLRGSLGQNRVGDPQYLPRFGIAGHGPFDIADHGDLKGRKPCGGLPAFCLGLGNRSPVAIEDRQRNRHADSPFILTRIVLIGGPKAHIRILPGDLQLQRGLSRLIVGQRSQQVRPGPESLPANLRRRRARGKLRDAVEGQLDLIESRFRNPQSLRQCGTVLSDLFFRIDQRQLSLVLGDASLVQHDLRYVSAAQLPLQHRDDLFPQPQLFQ